VGGKKISVMEALKKTSFSKVYIMLGINETGWPYSNLFIQKYGEIIDEIKNINPEAIIYVQSILPVSQKVSSSHSYVKNTKISEYNLLIQQMAEEKEIYYINSAESVATTDGYLPEEAASDGIHLKKDYCYKWLEYLKTHTANAK
jgi:lysophospholipase L1-like esterase